MFLVKLCAKWELLRTRFDVNKIGTEKEWKEEFPLVKIIGEHLKNIQLEGQFLVLKAVTTIADRRGHWCEGCPCHSADLKAGRKVDCVWRGRRGSYRTKSTCDDSNERIHNHLMFACCVSFHLMFACRLCLFSIHFALTSCLLCSTFRSVRSPRQRAGCLWCRRMLRRRCC